MTQDYMYPTAGANAVTRLSEAYDPGTPALIRVASTENLPSATAVAPAIVVIADDTQLGNKYLIAQYTGKTAATLTGVTVLRGIPDTYQTYPIGSIVMRSITEIDMDTIQDNIRDLAVTKADLTHASRHRYNGADPAVIDAGQVTTGVIPVSRGGTGASSIAAARSGLQISNVDNTRDTEKPVSTPQAQAIAVVQGSVNTHITNKSNPHAVSKSQVGLGNVDNTSDANKPVSTAQQTALDAKADLVDGKVPAAQLPAYVDDVLEYSNRSAFPGIGESGKIYIATDTNLTYRWTGSTYVEISASLALGETSSTAYRGDRGKIAYDHSQITTGNPHDIVAAEIPYTDTTGRLQGATVQRALDLLALTVYADATIYGVEIDESVVDPATACTYTDAAADYTPMSKTDSGSWGGVFSRWIVPMVLGAGATEQYSLDPTDLSKKSDGTAADLTGTDGDVVNRIPALYIRYSKSGTTKKIQISESPLPGFAAMAHYLGGEVRPYIYVGMFEGTSDTTTSVLRSRYSTEEQPRCSRNIDQFRTMAKLSGPTYTIVNHTVRSLLCSLFVLFFKSRNSQGVVGMGHVSSPSYDNGGRSKAVGADIDLAGGPNQGDTAAGLTNVYCLYFANLWGNVWEFADGMFYDMTGDTKIVYVSPDNSTINLATTAVVAPDNWISIPSPLSGCTSGSYVRVMQDHPVHPWLATTASGTSSTGYCDAIWHVAAGTTKYICLCGGSWYNGANAGLFYLNLYNGVANSYVYIGARLLAYAP